MQIKWTEEAPRKIQRYAGADYPSENPDLEDVLTSADVDHVAEIFQTPLSGSYNWDYTYRMIGLRSSMILASSSIGTLRWTSTGTVRGPRKSGPQR